MLSRYSITFTFVFLTLVVSYRFAVASEQNKEPPTLQTVISKLDAMIRRIDALEQRISRLEQSVVKLQKRTIGRYDMDSRGILYNRNGRRVGIWGVDSSPSGAPIPR